jgi:hypothetical protein
VVALVKDNKRWAKANAKSLMAVGMFSLFVVNM